MNRRHFFTLSIAGVASAAAAAARRNDARPPRVLLRSSWQVVNIGDIAHTPGVLALLEEHVPGAEAVLWASGDLGPAGVLLRRRFPKLNIVQGTIGADGKASHADLADALAWCDFLLHGSGPSLVAAKDVAAFVKHVRKPFGVYGITHGSFPAGDDKQLLGQAKFVFFRDSVSLARAREEGVACPKMEFAPDGAFACDLRDDARATRFLAENGLEEGKFFCCLSRLRYTPYWTIPGDKRRFDEKRHARNEAMKEHDHAPLREAIVGLARRTAFKVLLCPEDKTQMAVGKELLYDKLPDDVKAKVVWRETFWLPDEALSVYTRAAGLFGSEMHSPIMAMGQGVPAIVCRFEEQTSKGLMWRDIGLGDWLFDFDQQRDRERLPEAVLALAADVPAARAQAAKAREFVRRRQRETMLAVKGALEESR